MTTKRVTVSEARSLIAAATVEVPSDDLCPQSLVSVIMITYHERFLEKPWRVSSRNGPTFRSSW